jgi:2-desacetyl-2-hydroxyethyl bacteriochlorophyllide A dehydrogenase
MRGVVYEGPGKLRLAEDLPRPQVMNPRDAVLRVTTTAICGTDLHPYRGELPGFEPGTVLGHEFTGTIAEAGSEVRFPIGTRVIASDLVACGRCASCTRGWHYQCAQVSLFGYSTVVGYPVPGGQADYVRVPFADVVLWPVPDDLTDEQVLFAGDILATGYAAVDAARVVPGELAAIVGAGPVGLCAAQCAAAAGASAVIVTDTDPARRAQAERLGFSPVEPDGFAAALACAGGDYGARTVIEAVGSDAALRTAVESAGPHGTVVAVGAHHSSAAPFPSGLAFARELTIRFVVGDPIRFREPVIALIRAGRLDPLELISHRLPLSDAVKGYELFDRREATKIVMSTSTG